MNKITLKDLAGKKWPEKIKENDFHSSHDYFYTWGLFDGLGSIPVELPFLTEADILKIFEDERIYEHFNKNYLLHLARVIISAQQKKVKK